jgi:hypothetical protein
MTTDDSSPRGFSLRRWSQRKLEATRTGRARAPDAAASVPGDAPPPPSAAAVAAATPPSATPVASGAPAQDAPPLPPVESLTIDSDFSPFLAPQVDETVKLRALKKLFRDPRFNVMDGLDTYIDDYSIADPIAPELVRQLAHARYLFDPPRTRVNEAGVVEDVPADEIARDADAAPRESPADLATDSPSTSSPAASPVSEPDRAAGSAEKPAQPLAGSEPARQ